MTTPTCTKLNGGPASAAAAYQILEQKLGGQNHLLLAGGVALTREAAAIVVSAPDAKAVLQPLFRFSANASQRHRNALPAVLHFFCDNNFDPLYINQLTSAYTANACGAYSYGTMARYIKVLENWVPLAPRASMTSQVLSNSSGITTSSDYLASSQALNVYAQIFGAPTQKCQ